MKQLLLTLSIFLFSYCLWGQTGTIEGKIFDSDKKPLQLATVTIFNAQDTTVLTYRMSNDNGLFKVASLPINKALRILVTFSGYDAFRKNFMLTTENSTFKLDSVLMQPTTKTLDEVVVVSERPPVSVKNDTIEFNANAFKTLPNALVEDLLRKLPGVRVDADGNITVNGKPVNKILVDGKSFFGDDPKMASRNLPAKAIDKVQVVDDKEQALLNGDNNTSNVGKVVNITLKKEYKKGAFGKVYAGGGTQDRYEAGGILCSFRDTLQLSILGYSNNLNRPGFSYGELMNAGGLQRSNSNRNSNSTSMSSGPTGGTNININGTNFGGNSNFGLTTSNGAGFNLNHAPDKKKSFYLQYYFGETKTDLNTDRRSLLYNSDTIVTNHQIKNAVTRNYGHSIGAGFKLNPDSVNTIKFNAGYTVGLQRDNPTTTINSANNLLGMLSGGNINQWNKMNNYNYNHNFIWTRLSRKKKGRSFLIQHSLNTGTNSSDNQTNALLHYYYPTAYDSLQNQLRQIRLPQTQAGIGTLYVEPLSTLFKLKLINNYRYNYVANTTQMLYPDGQGSYDISNQQLSGSFKRNENYFNFFQKLEFSYKGLSIAPGLRESLVYSGLHTSTSANTIHRDLQKIDPNLDISYKNLSLSYTKNYLLPSYTYLLPITDNSNPYYIVNGNPNLNIAEQKQWQLSYNYNNQKSNLNIWFWSNYNLINNDVVQKTIVDNQGIQTTTPVNADGTRNLWLNFNVNKDFKLNEKDKVTLSAGGYYGIMRSRLLYNADSSWQTTNQLNHWFGVNFNFHDLLEWNNSYSPSFNFTRYTSNNFTNLNVTTQYLTSGVVLRWPKHVIWESNLTYQYNSSLPEGNKNNYRLDAAINYTFLKDDRGVLKISAYDILNQNKDMVRLTASQNMLTYNRGNLMPQYFLATFTYNIRQVGGKKQKVGGQSLFSL